MLKWAVTHRRETTASRPLTTDGVAIKRRESAPGSAFKRRESASSATKVKRRRSSTSVRRSSIYHDPDKENQFTSTPIKNSEAEALRDVSNLTPKERRLTVFKQEVDDPAYNDFANGHFKHKKKKRCLDHAHSQDFLFNPDKNSSRFFRPFETVDSHIESLLVNNDNCRCSKNKTPEQGVRKLPATSYAPTLPTYSMEYSPFRESNLLPPGISRLKPPLDELYPPNKKARIDHVNDFLHQISHVTSPEEEREIFPSLNVSAETVKENGCNEIKVSPLVQRLVDLRFNKNGCDRRREGINDSSFINDLSLDQIVEAILDSSPEVDSKTIEERRQVKENELNETHEENLINTENEKQTISNVDVSIDSGFRSNSTENSHHIDSNFVCKCSGTSLVGRTLNEKTIINLDETYNERCVDVPTRKRSSTSPSQCSSKPKRLLLDNSYENPNFTLKRQKCIRRRKNSSAEKMKRLLSHGKPSTISKPKLPETLDCDNSFELSDITSKESTLALGESDVVSSLEKDTSDLKTPADNLRRTRRCLKFDSPNSSFKESLRCSTPKPETRGVLDLRISYEKEELVVNVIRCWDLHRSNGKQINAYVKVFLSDRLNDSQKRSAGTLQRTPVQADSSKPVFNHVFRIPLQKTDFQKKLNLEAWHRDRCSRRSEFLGCMSFAVKNAAEKEISGSYRLLPQSSGRGQNLPLTNRRQIADTMCDSQSSVEELMTIDDLEVDLLRKTPGRAATSQQQKDADENLFLRYLELDPTEGPEAINAALQRKATGNKNGRTPFTITKRLTRAPKSGFGFSVVWTHPPRIERVEKGMPADKAGVLPGDYIIFVDKQNVVMMPEIDILNLIRSYGNQLTLEIFRRNPSKNGSVPSVRRMNSTGTGSTTGLHAPSSHPRRPSTVCSTNTATASVDYNRRKLHLPQVTFSAEKMAANPEESRRKAIYQLISKEQQYATGLQYAVTRFVSALKERKDLITNAEHRILFQNSEDLLRITEEILEAVVPEVGDIHIDLVISTYKAKLQEITSAYKRYCTGIKRADCVLANKSKNPDFARFLQTPAIPRRRPDITAFIHKPLEHYREVLKLLNVILSNIQTSQDDYAVICQIVHDMQLTYREITAGAGLMEPVGEGRPLLSVQDLESRLVFTKCKPFVLSKPGRQWIFGGDLSRVEGRNVRQYWALLFNDLLLFAKASRDRVLFVTEEPIPLAHITDLCFNIRKKVNEFRITIEPGGRSASSPTIHCGPDLTRTPRRGGGRKTMLLRAPTLEMKAVWQNLLQRQIFHVNSGMDSSAFSSPLESPDAPITSSVATLQSAESLSYRRQTPQSINITDNAEAQRQIDELIEHKCKQLSKTNGGTKGNAIHLEQWMKGQLGANQNDPPEVEPEIETWTLEMIRKRSEELQLLDSQGAVRPEVKRSESRCEELILSDHDQSPSKSTTTESQVTVRSSPLVPETVPVCRQCHKTCLNNENRFNSNPVVKEVNSNSFHNNPNSEDDWQPLMLMGLNAAVSATSLVKIDPFAAPVPQISIVPPTPDSSVKASTNLDSAKDGTCNCPKTKPQLNDLELHHELDNSPDESPLNEDHPYHSLSSSNLTLKRYGTVSSLERLAIDEDKENESRQNSSDSDSEGGGIYNDGFNGTSLRNWTARAGSFVIEKMAIFERLGGNYKAVNRLSERYLKTSENHVNGEDAQEDETSGATSGEEIWGTPTSGGETEDPLSSPNYDGRFSPNDGSISSENDESTELMMDELLMTPPITGAAIRGLLPRRTLEPLMEEEYSESCSSSSTQTEPSISPEQGSGTGDAADTCSTAAEKQSEGSNNDTKQSDTTSAEMNVNIAKIHRSDSYRHIIEADESAAFINRFSSTAKFIDIEPTPKARTVKIFGFFNVRRERRIHETFPEGKHLIKLFSKEDCISEVPSTYSQKQISQHILKDKQMDRRFWKQLSRRRSNKAPTFPA